MGVSINKVIIAGNLTSDVELRQTANGISVARVSVAVHRKRQKQGEAQKTDFLKVVLWRHSAEFIARYAHKGDNVVVSGELQNENWTDSQGKNHTDTIIVADEVELNRTKQQPDPNEDTLPFNEATPF